jgi:hypothetical protein
VLPWPSCISQSPFNIRGPSVITFTVTAIDALLFRSPGVESLPRAEYTLE